MTATTHDDGDQLLKRHPQNPLFSASDWPYRMNSVFNAAAVRLQSGETLLLCRAEDRTGLSHRCAARSSDGLNDWRIDDQPTLLADPQNHPEEAWGIEDPRAVWIPELGRYAVTYTCYSHRGPGVSLALTSDFHEFERLGIVLPVENKDAALFPRRFGQRWALLHRPVPLSVGGAHIWIGFSPDLRYWGDHSAVIEARSGPWWDGGKIGLSPPPIETGEGWLVLYHGVRKTVSGSIYYLGLALLDLDDLTRCIRRGKEWIFGPGADYERSGDVDNVVFPCGYTVGDDGDTLYLYYGAADTSIALATGSIRQMLDWLKG